jgi:hypothetical protein
MRVRNSLVLVAMGFAALGCDEPLGQSGEDVPSAAVWVTHDVQDEDFIDFCVRGGSGWLGPAMHTLNKFPNGLPRMEEAGPFPISPGSYPARLSRPEWGVCQPSLNGIDITITVGDGNYNVFIEGYAFPTGDQPPLSLTLEPRP